MWENILNGDSAYSIRLKLNKIGSSAFNVYPAIIEKDKWSEGPPYIQEIETEINLEDDHPSILPVYSSDSNVALNERKSWMMIDQAITGENKIIFSCFKKKPDIDVNIKIRRI